ncbi:sporulation-specific protein 22 [Friedmanniomyces endolithicus]|nr:sporulation-specific protein 22 [Friedmanniomyces endolithicus]
MAPVRPAKSLAIQHNVQQVLDCASKINSRLRDRGSLSESLEAELNDAVKRSLPLPPSTELAGEISAFDALGSQIWNAATNILRDLENAAGDGSRKQRPQTRLLVLLRVFGFFLIDAAHPTSIRRTKDHDQRVRTFKIALKACRFSLDHGEFELALKVLERCSEYASTADESFPIVRISDAAQSDDVNQQLVLKQLVAEYYLLRLTYAWKTDCLDLADHFFAKLNLHELAGSVILAEKAADLFHEAAKSVARKKLWDPAIKWCERAVSALDECEIEDLSHDAPELRLAITATWIEALLTGGTGEIRQRALNLIEQLETAYGMSNRIVVSLMRFQILTASKPVDLAQVDAVVAQMTRQAVLTDKSFKTIMQTVNKLRRISLHSALVGLTDFITTRLLPDCVPDDAVDERRSDRLERAIVTYVIFVTTSDELPARDTAAGVKFILDEVSHRTTRTLSARATHAAQTLIWKKTGAADAESSDEWCQLLRHAVFESAGHMNKAKIGRKAIAAALSRNDTNAARHTFFELPGTSQNESITRYLIFKVALRDGDYELAIQCLALIAKHAEKDATYLYACVLEAQQSNMRQVAVAALQALSERQPPGVHLPTLLRCTARLLVSELDANTQDIDRMSEPVVLLFERAAKNIPALMHGSDAQWRLESQWWSKNAYNLALRLCADIHPEHLVRLLEVCVRFLDRSPLDDGPTHQHDVQQRRMLCHFLTASALIVLGRSDESSYSLECYSRARGHITTFMTCCADWTSANDMKGPAEAQRHIVLARKFEMLKFDLECILKLKQWDQLDKAVTDFLSFTETDRWDSLADLVIIIHEHARADGATPSATARIHELLQKCINMTWKKDKDIRKMSRWLRLTFSIHLHDGNPDFALKVVQQAAGVVQKGYNHQADVYPLDELCWLATTAFNKSIDCLNTGDSEGAAPWTVAALDLARYADDSGSLHANLTHRKEAAEERMRAMSARA